MNPKNYILNAQNKIPKRSPTRPELLLDNFEKTCEKVKNDIHEQELKAIQKSTESYELLVKIIKKTEKLHTQLPKIIFHQFMGEVNGRCGWHCHRDSMSLTDFGDK